MRRIISALTAGAFALAGAGAASAAQTPHNPAAAAPAQARPAWLNSCSTSYFHRDARLGPAHLPRFGRVAAELTGYRRAGSLGERRLLARFYSPTANAGTGGWIYPPGDGYVLGPGGRPVERTATLPAGREIDRYGSEYGSFLAPAGLPYAKRSIPPQNLDGTPAAACDYHDYRVLKPFAVDAGPTAPWFGQPGRGLQYQLLGALVPGAPASLNVSWLVANGYLKRLA